MNSARTEFRAQRVFLDVLRAEATQEALSARARFAVTLGAMEVLYANTTAEFEKLQQIILELDQRHPEAHNDLGHH